MQAGKVHHLAGFACPLCSALRVWLPSRRLSPFHNRAGFVSHRQRSWDSPFGAFSSHEVSGRFRPEEPTYRFSRRYTHTREVQGAGSTSRGSWVLTLVRVPGSQHVFSRPAAGCSPGFSPFRATRESLGQDFARPPLTRFLVRIYTLPPAPQSLHQLPLDLILPARRTGWGRVRHPLRVPAPSQS
jgi:hypothetical protein